MYRVTLVLASLCLFVSAALGQSAPAATDVYHVNFSKAAPGQARALETQLKQQDPKAAMPGHYLVLRHQQGDDWDYMVIEHLGKKVTLDPSQYSAPTGTAAAVGSWHTDTFVIGPSWEEFAKQMGMSGDKAAVGVYIVATWRAVPGHRQELAKILNSRDANAKVQTGNVVVSHIEGGPWQYLTLERYNSWQDYATSEAASQDSATWYDIRDHGVWHHDTVTTRVMPASAPAQSQ